VSKRDINNTDREQWIANDEGLHDMRRRSRLSLREFIRENRTIIDEVIHTVRDGIKPAHDLKYGNPNWREVEAQEKRIRGFGR
jgi:hypothetical protein